MTPEERATMQPSQQAVAAMRLALDALCNAVKPKHGFYYSLTEVPIDCAYKYQEAIAALREALAESNMNLNCKSVQARLATSRWYVRAEQAEQIPQKERKDFIDGYDAGMADAKRMQQAEQSQLADATLEPVAWGCRFQDGSIHDCICPESHAECEGDYNIPLYAAPVHTKDPCNPLQDLTDDEIEAIRMGIIAYEPTGYGRVFARAVIAADRSKNGII